MTKQTIKTSRPQAVLACINVTSLRQMFLQFQDLPELWRISKIDFVSAPTWRQVKLGPSSPVRSSIDGVVLVFLSR